MKPEDRKRFELLILYSITIILTNLMRYSIIAVIVLSSQPTLLEVAYASCWKNISHIPMVYESSLPDPSNGTLEGVIEPSFAINEVAQALVISSFFYGYLGSIFNLNFLLPNLGPRLMITISMVIPGLINCYYSYAATEGFQMIMLLRILQGLFSGGVRSSVRQIIKMTKRTHDAIDTNDLLGYIYSMQYLGALISFIIVAQIEDYSTFFTVTGALSVTVGGLIYLLEDNKSIDNQIISDHSSRFWADQNNVGPVSRGLFKSFGFWKVMIVSVMQTSQNIILTAYIPKYLYQIYGQKMPMIPLISVFIGSLGANKAKSISYTMAKFGNWVSMGPVGLLFIIVSGIDCQASVLALVFILLGICSGCSIIHTVNIQKLPKCGLIINYSMVTIGCCILPQAIGATISSNPFDKEAWANVWFRFGVINVIASLICLISSRDTRNDGLSDDPPEYIELHSYSFSDFYDSEDSIDHEQVNKLSTYHSKDTYGTI